MSPQRDFQVCVPGANVEKTERDTHHMLKIIVQSVVCFFVAAQMSRAEPVKGVVELFTSQSCSSCPPADKVFATLIQRNGIIGLAYHVDYWDYLNWKDTFSLKDSSERQYAYAKSFGSKQVFTPQMILNGQQNGLNGAPDDIQKTVDTLAKSPDFLPVSITAKLSADRVSVTAGKGVGEAHLILIVFNASETVTMNSGENAGLTVEYRNAVTSIQTIGMWKGDTVSVELPRGETIKNSGLGCVVLLQRISKTGAYGEIIGATLLQGSPS